ncbi:hypothetical protein ACEPUM_09685 [Pseudomonas aeruginosa]
MNLPLVDPFTPSFSSAAGDVATAAEAAVYVARHEVDNHNKLRNHIEAVLKGCAARKAWRSSMPSKTPVAIATYQKNLRKCDLDATSAEIDAIGHLLSDGQFLFHGGLWSFGRTAVTSRPLSTSLCPVVAFQNALHSAKAYDAGQLDIMVLKVTDPQTKAFVFKPKGTSLGHEFEVLFASGANLTFKSRAPIRSDFLAVKYDHPDKHITVNVIEAELS